MPLSLLFSSHYVNVVLLFLIIIRMECEWSGKTKGMKKKNFQLYFAGDGGAKQTKRHWIKEENTLTPNKNIFCDVCLLSCCIGQKNITRNVGVKQIIFIITELALSISSRRWSGKEEIFTTSQIGSEMGICVHAKKYHCHYSNF